MDAMRKTAFVFLGSTLALTALATAVEAQPRPELTRSYVATNTSRALPMRSCWRLMGPFQTQYRAHQVRAYWQRRGYAVSGVWGQGGMVVRGGRRYYFRLYYRC